MLLGRQFICHLKCLGLAHPYPLSMLLKGIKVAMHGTRTSYWIGVRSVRVVFRCNTASDILGLKPSQWPPSSSKSDYRSRQCASFLVESTGLKALFGVSWLLRTLSQQPFKNGKNNNTAQFSGSHFQFVMSNSESESFGKWYQYMFGLFIPSRCICSRTQEIWLWWRPCQQCGRIGNTK